MNLIKDLKRRGFCVKIVCPKDNFSKELHKSGLEIINWQLSRKSINPFLEFFSMINLIMIYSKERPYFVHHFTIKSCLYGTIAAKLTNISKIFNAITGLGHIFISTKKSTQLIRFLIKPLFKLVFLDKRSTQIFQNQDDQKEFLKLGFTNLRNSRIIKGSGVDTKFFKPAIDSSIDFHNPIKILFPSRIIKEKGLLESVLACKSLKEEGYEIELLIAGEIDYGNRSAFTKDELKILKKNKFIKFLGHIKNMYELYLNVDIVILPSWREGLSKTLIEASSMEKPIITSNVPGCRDVVENNVNGLLVPKKNFESIVIALKYLISNPKIAKEFGKKSRIKAIKEFEINKINKETINEYEVYDRSLINKKDKCL